MTTPLLPEDWEELIAGYALGDLSPEETEALERLLATNPELNAEVARLQETLALMPYALPEQAPPPQLRDTILAAAQRPEAQRSAQASAPPPHRPLRPQLTWQRFGGAIAALLMVALAVDNFRLRDKLQDAETVVSTLWQPNTLVYTLKGTGSAPAASGTLVVNPNHHAVVVAVQNLPALPAGQAYRLWAIAPGVTQPIYCGQFNSTVTGTTSHWTAPEAVCGTAVPQMLITVESATAPPQPAGALVMQSES
jgi:anti-sigma-K factor RskA